MNEVNFHFDNVYNDNPMNLGLFYLLQIGDISCKGGYIGPLHRQKCYEISYIVSGKGEFIVDDVIYPVKKGNIIITFLGEMHYTRSSVSNPLRFFYIGFNFNIDSEKYDAFDSIIDMFKNRKSPVFDDNFNIYNNFVNAFNEFVCDNAMRNEIIESYIQQILCYTYRNYNNEYGKIYSEKAYRSSKDDIVYDIINFIDINVIKIKKLTDISDYFNYSYPYISVLFSKDTGMTLRDYICEKKIEYAEKLLETDKSITEISTSLGYDSIHTFSRIFKKKSGMSPSSYRIKYQNLNNKSGAV